MSLLLLFAGSSAGVGVPDVAIGPVSLYASRVRQSDIHDSAIGQSEIHASRVRQSALDDSEVES